MKGIEVGLGTLFVIAALVPGKSASSYLDAILALGAAVMFGLAVTY